MPCAARDDYYVINNLIAYMMLSATRAQSCPPTVRASYLVVHTPRKKITFTTEL